MNLIENWMGNNKLISMFQRPKPRIKELIQCFKTETENLACIVMRVQLNMEGKWKTT